MYSKSIFIIEDDPLYGNSLKRFIEERFPEINSVNTFSIGEMSLLELKNNPAVIIVDYLLNSTFSEAHDGLQIIKHIKREKPNTNIIVLSAQQNPNIISEAEEQYGCKYVQKDKDAFQQIELLVKEYLDKKRSATFEPWA